MEAATSEASVRDCSSGCRATEKCVWYCVKSMTIHHILLQSYSSSLKFPNFMLSFMNYSNSLQNNINIFTKRIKLM